MKAIVDMNDAKLKPYTEYICPVGAGRVGHGSLWTGAYPNHRPGDGTCPCGEAYIEVDSREGDEK